MVGKYGPKICVKEIVLRFSKTYPDLKTFVVAVCVKLGVRLVEDMWKVPFVDSIVNKNKNYFHSNFQAAKCEIQGDYIKNVTKQICIFECNPFVLVIKI